MHLPIRFTLVLFAIALVIGPKFARADMPLFQAIEETKTVGPRTEAIDLSAYQRVLYVSASATAPGANGTREHPFSSLRAAMDAIQGESDTQRFAVLVSAGAYPTTRLQMRSFVDLFGGYGEDWQRDIALHKSVLDANQSGPVVLGADHARIDGFVITNGRHAGAGGGVLCDHVSPVISNNVIRGNATVEPEGFRRDMIHQRGSDGGGVALLSGSNAELRGNLICNNTTGIGNGGGVFIWNDSSPRVFQNVICDNHTGLTGRPGHDGSRSSNGGGIAVSFSCHPEILANIVSMNSVADNSDAGGIYLEYDAHAHIKGNWITGNFGMDDGGGMYVMKLSQPLVERNVFAGNRNTSGASSQIRLSKEGRMRAINNLFISPTSAMDVVHSWLVLEHNTFVCFGGIAMVWENELSHYASPQINQNILVGQIKPQIFVKPGPVHPHISRNLVPGGLDGEQNIDGDPRFIDDSVKGTITGARFDSDRFVTSLTASGATSAPGSLVGRVIQMGERCSVVESNAGQEICVWGPISAKSADFIVFGTYQPAKDAPYGDVGAYSTALPGK